MYPELYALKHHGQVWLEQYTVTTIGLFKHISQHILAIIFPVMAPQETRMDIGKSLEDPKRATVMFEGPENVLYDIFTNPETKTIVEASGHIYEPTTITRRINTCPNC